MRKNLSKYFSIFALMASLFWPTTASAIVVTDPGVIQAISGGLTQAVNNVKSAVDKVKTAVDQSKDKIVEAIRGLATSNATAASESARLISSANNKVVTEMEKNKIDRDAIPLDPCSVTAAAKGGRNSVTDRPIGYGRGSGTSSGSGGTTPVAGASTEMANALKIASGAVATPSAEIATAIAAKGACATFAKSGVREASCKEAGFSTNLSSGFPNADIRAETLFDGPQSLADAQSGSIKRRLTIPAGDSKERTAVAAFIRNLETPVDLRTLTKLEIDSEAGRNYMALRDSYDASISLASKPMRDQETLISANKATIPVIKQLLKGEDAKFVKDYLTKAYPSWESNGISYAELIQLEAARRYLNEDWHVRVAAANEKQLITEGLQLQAFKAWTDTLALERLQQVAILQGLVAGASVRAEKMPLLSSVHKSAKR